MTTNYMTALALGKQFGNVDFNIPTYYLGLSKTKPNADGTNDTPPVGGNYARVALANNTANFIIDAATRTAKVKGIVEWNESTGNWSDNTNRIKFVTVWDSKDGGHLLYACELDKDEYRLIETKMQMWIEAGGITFKYIDVE